MDQPAKSKKKKTSVTYNHAGQPSPYKAEFHPKEFIRLSKKGKNLTQIASLWDLSRETLYKWQHEHAEFSDACKTGRACMEAWYTDVGHRAMFGKQVRNEDGEMVSVDYRFFEWMSKNVCKWSDRVESKDVTDPEKKPAQIFVTQKKVKKILKQLDEEC